MPGVSPLPPNTSRLSNRHGGTIVDGQRRGSMSPDDFIAELWGYAQEVPMAQHPWFQGILQHRWTRTQLILGEVQHYLRVRTNPIFFGYIAINAVAEKHYEVMDVVL